MLSCEDIQLLDSELLQVHTYSASVHVQYLYDWFHQSDGDV